MSFGLLEGLDYRGLAGSLGERPLIREVYGGLRAPRHPSRGEPVGLSSWHAKIVSANQD